MTDALVHRPPHHPQLADALDHVRRAIGLAAAVPLGELTHAAAEACLDARHALHLAKCSLERAARVLHG